MSVCSVLGILSVLFAIYEWTISVMIKKRCIAIGTATLIRLDCRAEMGALRRWRNYFVPVYSYEVEGREYICEGKEYRLRPEYFEINSTCEVKYNPYKPDMCVIKKKTGKEYIGAFFFVLGAFLVFVGRY